MEIDLFAGMRVSDYTVAKTWYERLLGAEPTVSPHATEAVWELAEHRFLFIVEDAENAGGALQTATRSASAARRPERLHWARQRLRNVLSVSLLTSTALEVSKPSCRPSIKKAAGESSQRSFFLRATRRSGSPTVLPHEALKVSTWNDGRLDELSHRTDAGFEEVKGEIKGLRAEMQAGFARVNGRFEKVESEIHHLANTIIGAGAVVTAAVLGTGIFFGLS